MKELRIGKTESVFGRILRAFGIGKASTEGERHQDENVCVHTPSHTVLFKDNSQKAARSAFTELESRRTQALLAAQRRPFTS